MKIVLGVRVVGCAVTFHVEGERTQNTDISKYMVIFGGRGELNGYDGEAFQMWDCEPEAIAILRNEK